MLFTMESSSRVLRADRQTSQPIEANCLAISIPIPREAPVTHTTGLRTSIAAEAISGKLINNKFEEFVARALVLTEGSEHSACCGEGILFFHTPHHHTEMLRFDNDRDAVRLKSVEERFGDLLCHALLYLQAARED